MERYSQRFQTVRSSEVNILDGGPPPGFPKRQHRTAGTHRTQKENNNKPEGSQQPSREAGDASVVSLLSAACKHYAAAALRCFRFILACLQVLFCQSKDGSQHPGTLREDTSPLKSKKRVSSSAFYSSDSEEDDEPAFYYEPCQEIDSSFGETCGHDVPVIDDYDIPIACLIDNIIYFFNLYCNNYPAFVSELSTCVRNWEFHPRRVHYGHNLNPKKRRPKLIKKGIEFLKRRKAKEKMSRVHGGAHKAWLLRIALLSRLIIFFLQIVANNILRKFKHANDGFKFTPEETYGKLLDPLVNTTLGGYVNWDAHYFLHNSVYGYTRENFLAFFPLLPMMLYLPSRAVNLILGEFISLSSIVLVLGVILNTRLFVKTADNVYEICKFRIGATNQLITAACIIFSFNPASIFFSGLYTETVFAWLTSYVLLYTMRGETTKALVCASLSGLCRSNGILNIGFILALDLQTEFPKLALMNNVISFTVKCVLKLAVSVFPFMMFQVYCHKSFCFEREYDDPAEVPLYCIETGLGWLPYSYLQKKYWNVGFLGYFEFKQLPNFVLAAPVLYILWTQSWAKFKICLTHLIKKMNPKYIYTLFTATHGLFLAIFCFFFVHVQVSTRMIMAACPYLFVYLAAHHEEEVNKFRNREINMPVWSLGLTLWCTIYYLIGTVAFSLGLPWT